jgi:hypothetical protein
MSGVITAASALWCLVFAFGLHTLVAGRVGHLVPGRVGTDVLPRGVSVLTLAGLAGLTVVTVGGALNRATTATAGWALGGVIHIPLAAHTVVAGAALLVALSVITAIIAGHAVSGRFMFEAVLASALLAAIPGHAGQFISALIRAAVRAAAFLVAVIFQVV